MRKKRNNLILLAVLCGVLFAVNTCEAVVASSGETSAGSCEETTYNSSSGEGSYEGYEGFAGYTGSEEYATESEISCLGKIPRRCHAAICDCLAASGPLSATPNMDNFFNCIRSIPRCHGSQTSITCPDGNTYDIAIGGNGSNNGDADCNANPGAAACISVGGNPSSGTADGGDADANCPGCPAWADAGDGGGPSSNPGDGGNATANGNPAGARGGNGGDATGNNTGGDGGTGEATGGPGSWGQGGNGGNAPNGTGGRGGQGTGNGPGVGSQGGQGGTGGGNARGGAGGPANVTNPPGAPAGAPGGPSNPNGPNGGSGATANSGPPASAQDGSMR